jgi:hypothetical protein
LKNTAHLASRRQRNRYTPYRVGMAGHITSSWRRRYRAAVIRRGIAGLGDRYGTEVWVWWNNNAGIWEVDFERLDGGPAVKELTAAIAGHRYLREHRGAIAVATEAGAIRWARAMREPGAAVILDTKTTGLAWPETSCRSPSSMRTPARCCWTRWSTGLPGRAGRPLGARHHRRAAGRRAAAGRGVAPAAGGHRRPHRSRTTPGSTAVRHARRDDLDPGHLADEHRWSRLMTRRTDWLMRTAGAARRRAPRPGGLRGRLRAAGRHDRPGLPAQGDAAMTRWLLTMDGTRRNGHATTSSARSLPFWGLVACSFTRDVTEPGRGMGRPRVCSVMAAARLQRRGPDRRAGRPRGGESSGPRGPESGPALPACGTRPPGSAPTASPKTAATTCRRS